MAEQRNVTQLDPDQIIKYKFDDALNADRVVLVGGENIQLNASIDSKAIGEEISKAITAQKLEVIKVPEIIKETDIRISEISVPQIIIQKEIEIKEVKIPEIITQTETKIVEVEKVVIVKEYEKLPEIKIEYKKTIFDYVQMVVNIAIIGLLIYLVRK